VIWLKTRAEIYSTATGQCLTKDTIKLNSKYRNGANNESLCSVTLSTGVMQTHQLLMMVLSPKQVSPEPKDLF
jgi:hypothetical protein